MAFNRRGRRPMPIGGGNSRMNNNPRGGTGGNSRFAPRGAQRFGVNPGPMPAGGASEGGGNFSGGRRQDPRYVQPQTGDTTFGGEGGMQNNFGGGRRQDPRFAQPLSQMDNNFGGGRKQDPRYAYGADDVNPRMGRNMNDSGIPLEGAYAGRRPVGLPNTNLRMPGSGGSRVMSTPTAGNFMRPKQPRENRLQRGKFPLGNSKSDDMGY